MYTNGLDVKDGGRVPGVRERLLDAAYDVAVAGDWAQTRMADIAAAAAVSRQTLYNEFGTKDGLAQALALREGERFLAAATEAVGDRPDPASAVAAAIAWSLDAAAANPLVKTALTDDATGLLPFLTTRSGLLVTALRDGVTGALMERWPELDAEETRWVAEVAVRLTVSHLVVPTEAAQVTVGHVETLAHRLL